MLKIALTGGPGTGKSSVLNIMSRMGFRVISADKIVRDLQHKPNGTLAKRIASVFGRKYLKIDGSINRLELRKLIFGSQNARKKLEMITHPLVIKKLKEEIKRLQNETVSIFEIPLLFEAKLTKLFDLNLVVSANKKNQIERLTKRDKISKSLARKMIDSQIPLKKKMEMADYVIFNTGSTRKLRAETKEFINFLKIKYGF